MKYVPQLEQPRNDEHYSEMIARIEKEIVRYRDWFNSDTLRKSLIIDSDEIVLLPMEYRAILMRREKFNFYNDRADRGATIDEMNEFLLHTIVDKKELGWAKAIFTIYDIINNPCSK